MRGELNATRGDGANVIRLEPASHEVIVGFYGRSMMRDGVGVTEFGIITVAKTTGLDGLPDAVYDLPELKNAVGMGDEANDEDDEEGDEDEDEDDDTVDGDD